MNTEFWEKPNTFSAALAREQGKRWGVWLVGNGNLGNKWDAYSDAEQDALLGMGADLVAPLQVAPPMIEQQVAALAQQVAELTAKQATTEKDLTALRAQRLVAETTIKVLPATT